MWHLFIMYHILSNKKALRHRRDMASNKQYSFYDISKCLVIALLFLVMPACSNSNSSTCTFNYWVATDGSDSASGDADNPFLTIEQARDTVRNDSARGHCTINVNIKGGTYRLESPLVFDSQDSGAPGSEVVYRAATGEQPVISGAVQVVDWLLSDASLNIWEAQVTVETETMPRQLYVNDLRGIRARTPDYPNYYTPTSTGYLYLYLIGSDPQIPPTWDNPTDVEAVTVTQWKMMRCPIDEIIAKSDVVMQQPCWDNVNVYPSPWNFHLLSWFENAYEFLDEPGEWYLDATTLTLYYIPREGEDMATADVELPVLETLVQGSGDISQPVSYIKIEGLSFMYATWLGPNTSDGYALDQSGFHLVGTDHESNIIGHDKDVVRTPGNLSFVYAQNISFTDNTFTHLGAVALDFGTGSQNNQIVNNTFNDISAAAIQVGGVQEQDHHPDDPAQLTSDNLISNNLIEYTGQDYYDAPGIYIGFTTRSIVEHNDINSVPWAGIAIGWGWGLLDSGGFPGLPNATQYEWGIYDTPSAALGNQIIYNHIQNFLGKMWDGGAIYTTGFQGTSLEDGQLIAWNVAESKRTLAGGNTFYTDGGSRFVTVKENVSLDNPQGFVDFGPCLKASSFEVLCLTTDILPYGEDMGGCVPYGDLLFENNYLRNHLTFYNICENTDFPDHPVDMSFIDNIKITDRGDVPAWILDAAGRQ